MNNLFTKIFAWFFAAALLLVSVSGMIWTLTRPGGEDPFAAFGIETSEEAATSDAAVVVDQMRVMQEPLAWLTEHGFDVVAFNANGDDLVGSSDIATVDLRPLALSSLSRQTALAKARGDGSLMLAIPVGASIAVGTIVPPRPPAPALSAEILRWSVPLGLSLLLCLALARYLSAPVQKFREATARLARGDLGVRIGPAMGRRRDELADAGRDFDVMAERIQQLIESERRLLGDISH